MFVKNSIVLTYNIRFLGHFIFLYYYSQMIIIFLIRLIKLNVNYVLLSVIAYWNVAISYFLAETIKLSSKQFVSVCQRLLANWMQLYFPLMYIITGLYIIEPSLCLQLKIWQKLIVPFVDSFMWGCHYGCGFIKV